MTKRCLFPNISFWFGEEQLHILVIFMAGERSASAAARSGLGSTWAPAWRLSRQSVILLFTFPWCYEAVPFNSRSVCGTCWQTGSPVAHKPTQSVTHRHSEPPTLPRGLRASRARQRPGSHKPKPAGAAGRPREPSQNRSLRSHTSSPPPPRLANIPTSKGRKAQPELLGVLQGWPPPGAAGEGGLYTSIWGSVVFISQILNKMLNKSHSIYTWFCRIVKMLVVTLCSFSSWIKKLFLKPALYASVMAIKISPFCLGGDSNELCARGCLLQILQGMGQVRDVVQQCCPVWCSHCSFLRVV